jgi:hypothetical protein
VKNRFLTLTALGAVMLGVITSCNKDDFDVIDHWQERIVFADETEAEGVRFKTAKSWTSSIRWHNGDHEWQDLSPDWISISPAHGAAGTHTIKISLTKNIEPVGQREAIITFDNGKSFFEIYIAQTPETIDGNVYPTALLANRTATAIATGYEQTLLAVVEPENAISKVLNWNSSNTAVATVNDGKVTAVATGIATITATTIEDVKRADWTVTVKAPSQLGDGEWYAYQTHTAGAGIDLVFMGDGYTADEIASWKYESDMAAAIEGFFEIQPYKAYRKYFNAYIVGAVSAESGIGDGSARNTRFSSYAYAIGFFLANTDLCITYAQKAPLNNIDNAVVTLIVNSNLNFGVAYFFGDNRIKCGFTICPANTEKMKPIVQHESGHGFAKLADEYYTIAYYQTRQATPVEQASIQREQRDFGWWLNVDVTNDPTTVLWKDLIGYDGAGIFEGGHYFTRRVWRSSETSIMKSAFSVPYFNAFSRFLIVKRIKELADEPFSLDWFKANDIIEPYTPTKSSAGVKSAQTVIHHPPVLIIDKTVEK